MTTSLRFWVITSSIFFSIATAHSQTSYNNEIKQYAVSLYNSFNQMQQRSGVLRFNDTARLKWNNLPVGLRARVGTSIGNMTDDQRKLVHRILSASFSSQGYLKATSIMHLDDLLNRFTDSLIYRKEINDSTFTFLRSLLWSHKNYFFAFFGQPTDSTWGYKLEGHHLSVNFTFVKDKLSVTPFFIGTDPAEYPFSEYAGWRVLGQEEDLGIKLIHLLSADQQKKAIMTKDVPQDIITAAESGKRLVDNWGILGADMNKEQKAVLQYIIREFVFNLEYDKAVIEYDKILKAGVDKIYFGWIGETEEKKPHYYVLNGPTFIIEFDNNGGPRKAANHIHAIWREKGNEYGEDVLKKHYLMEKH
jgi:flagellar hook-associated protein FlgK